MVEDRATARKSRTLGIVVGRPVPPARFIETLAAVLEVAVEYEHIDRNPAKGAEHIAALPNGQPEGNTAPDVVETAEERKAA